MREQHFKLKRQVDQIKEAEKQDEQFQKFNNQRAQQKPTTAATNMRNGPSLNKEKRDSVNMSLKRP